MKHEKKEGIENRISYLFIIGILLAFVDVIF